MRTSLRTLPLVDDRRCHEIAQAVEWPSKIDTLGWNTGLSLSV